MFLGRKNQYCTTKHNLKIQCNPYQITNGIFHRTRTKNFTIHMETQKTLNSQSSLEKEEWSWRNPLPDSRLSYKATVIKTVCYGTPGSDMLTMRIRRICCLTNLGTIPLVSSEAVME